jgi:hypothetical protein
MRRALAVLAVVALASTGCSSTDQPAAEASKAPSPSVSAEATDSPGAQAQEPIEIEIEGDKIEPNGKRVQVKVGEPIRLDVESDRDAELHVHSSPEQELEVKKGESTLDFTVDTPGIVEVEEHHSGIVILQLEVR